VEINVQTAGHSGLDNKSIKEISSGGFNCVLSLLKIVSGGRQFVAHIHSSVQYGGGLQPHEFLSGIGLKRFSGECPFHRRECYFRILYEPAAGVTIQDSMPLHNQFETFITNLEKLYRVKKEEKVLVQGIDQALNYPHLFGAPIDVTPTGSVVPDWVNEHKFERLRELEASHTELVEEIEDLNMFLPLLYGTGDPLEDAVVHALRYLGMEAERTDPGFTIDVLSSNSDKSINLGVEVTGINDAIKKKSPKLSQAYRFEQIKENNEKIIILANTFNDLPIEERSTKVSFTKEVLEILKGQSVLLMTGWDLYRLVGTVMAKSKSSDDVINTLYKTEGVLSV